jgi:hypothetical protein
MLEELPYAVVRDLSSTLLGMRPVVKHFGVEPGREPPSEQC